MLYTFPLYLQKGIKNAQIAIGKKCRNLLLEEQSTSLYQPPISGLSINMYMHVSINSPPSLNQNDLTKYYHPLKKTEHKSYAEHIHQL